MYKLVAIDLDGTMLNNYGIVTDRTKKAIEKGAVWFFNCYVRPYYDGALINSDSIKYDKEKKCILFTYNYETYPDLYL